MYILFAQTARPQALSTTLIISAAAALLRAIRLQTLSLALYGLLITLSLCTFVLSALVAFEHGVYVFAIERFRRARFTAKKLQM